MTSIFMFGIIFIRIVFAVITTSVATVISTATVPGFPTHSESTSAATRIPLSSITITQSTSLSTSTSEAPNLGQISSSISSLLGLLQPASSVSSELTAIPASVVSGLEGPNVMSVYDQLFTSIGPDWFVNLPYGAENWVVGLEGQAATILPQIISLQSLANHDAGYTTSAGSLVSSSISLPTPKSGGEPSNDFFPTATAMSSGNANSTGDAKAGLGTGGKIGLGVGLTIFVLLTCGAAFMLWYIKKNRKYAKAVKTDRELSHPSLTNMQELHANSTPDVEKNSASSGFSTHVKKFNRTVEHEVHEMPSPEMESWAPENKSGTIGTGRRDHDGVSFAG